MGFGIWRLGFRNCLYALLFTRSAYSPKISTLAQRLISQVYFEGDPMIWQCPIVSTIADKAAIDQLTAVLDRNATLPMDALAYKFDIVLRGRRSTMFENRMEGN